MGIRLSRRGLLIEGGRSGIPLWEIMALSLWSDPNHLIVAWLDNSYGARYVGTPVSVPVPVPEVGVFAPLSRHFENVVNTARRRNRNCFFRNARCFVPQAPDWSIYAPVRRVTTAHNQTRPGTAHLSRTVAAVQKWHTLGTLR
jgi:hypothetical protein